MSAPEQVRGDKVGTERCRDGVLLTKTLATVLLEMALQRVGYRVERLYIIWGYGNALF